MESVSDIQRYTAEDYYVRPAPTVGEYVLYADHVAAMESQELRLGRHYEQVMKDAVAEAERRARDKQRADDYVTLWARLMLEDRKYRSALARAALVLRGRWTDQDILAMTGKVVSLHEWETVKPAPDAYDLGRTDALAAAVAAIRKRGGYHSSEEFAQLIEQVAAINGVSNDW